MSKLNIMKTFFIVIFGLSLILSCSTSNKTAKSSLPSEQDFLNNNLDLTSQLRLLPGVMIRGEAESASFQVRGASSISSSTEPLFVLNGRAFENYATVYRMVNPLNFKSARVLKNASDIAFYGSRGANGVIVIETK